MFREKLSFEAWTERAEQHRKLIMPFADAFVQRRSLGLKHPVHDFLFTYYNCSPQKLKQWVPSFEEELVVIDSIEEKFPWLREKWFCKVDDRLFLDLAKLHDHVRYHAEFICELCDKIAQRPPRFGCFGLHEWAMVYNSSQEEIRHNGYRLRLSPAELKEFVDSQALCCTHYDAYRFFTAEARPLNVFQPKLETRLDFEQGGCIHANMDLYKWACKLWPWIGSDLIGKTFLLAIEGRELDMRASPYDLSEHGYIPLCIETEEGRKEYQKEQQQYAARAMFLRNELQKFCIRFLSNYPKDTEHEKIHLIPDRTLRSV